jgi:hypothetical protein
LTDLQNLLKPYAKQPPNQDRRRRLLTTIILPDPDFPIQETDSGK